MKINYDLKTNFMSLRFQSIDDSYVEEFAEGIDVVKSEVDDSIIGFNFYEASTTIKRFGEISVSGKLALLTKLHRKILGLTQQDLSDMTGIPLQTIKMIEKGEKDTSIENLSKIKKALPKIDLNCLSVSKIAS